MNSLSLRHIPGILIAAIVVAACVASRADGQVAPIQPGPTGGPPILRDVGIDNHEGDSVPPDLIFRDETGRSVHLAEYFGRRPIILACKRLLSLYPMLCTMVLNDLTRLRHEQPERKRRRTIRRVDDQFRSPGDARSRCRQETAIPPRLSPAGRGSGMAFSHRAAGIDFAPDGSELASAMRGMPKASYGHIPAAW